MFFAVFDIDEISLSLSLFSRGGILCERHQTWEKALKSPSMDYQSSVIKGNVHTLSNLCRRSSLAQPAIFALEDDIIIY